MEFYRYEIRTSVSISDDCDYKFVNLYRSVNLVLNTYNLFKETPKGYWIGYGNLNGYHSRKRWIPKESKKRFAYPTKEEALVNFIKRTEKRIKIHESTVSDCRYGIKLANNFLEILENERKGN